MIVGQEVLVAEILGGLSVVSDYFRVGAYLILRESESLEYPDLLLTEVRKDYY